MPAATAMLHAGARLAAALLDPSEVAVESDRRFRVPVPRAVAWRLINRVDLYPKWWPWLRQFDARALQAGDVWTCVVQPPVPYALGFAIHLDEVVPGRSVVATIRGDIEGTARLEIEDRRGGCEIHLVSTLAPHSPVLRAAATLVRPMAQYGHDWVLDTGARQFARAAARAAASAAAGAAANQVRTRAQQRASTRAEPPGAQSSKR